ncbi:GNAT family N-acetyltransferase [Gammaproteobacteria bacterium LSUCC0057]|uniref:GNAT family N-acetyltransferase n=1 Tax=Gammaproteobacteria bacterium LSUCC0057 TaxID=2559237 RepID=A0A4Y8UJX1_9GAMM|nr:GNAT family N-acetyltransferase [Gammaproteobacteria bacterium LSUCC0057]
MPANNHSSHIISHCLWRDDSEILLAVRIAVFVAEQGVPLALEVDHHDARADHWLVRSADGAAIGCARLLEDGKIGRLAVLKQWRGRGIATQLMAAIEAFARRRGCTKLQLGAQLQALEFYRRLGYREYGKPFDDAGIAHMNMVKELQ